MSIGGPEALEMSNLYRALQAAGEKEQQELKTPPDEEQRDVPRSEEDVVSNQAHELDETT